MSRDRDIWGIPRLRRSRRRDDESATTVAERLHAFTEAMGRLFGFLLAWGPRSSPPAAAQVRPRAQRQAPPRDVVPPHPYLERLPSPPRSDLAAALRTLSRSAHGVDDRARKRALERVRRSVPDLVEFFDGDYMAARQAVLELRIALQSRAEGIALAKLLPDWRKRAAAARATADEGSVPQPVPETAALTF